MTGSQYKRAFDIAGACAGLLVFAPVMAVVIPAVPLDDGRPVLFRQPRLGLRRRPFSILKIRTMRDGRVTRVGRILRATGLDEIPQFIREPPNPRSPNTFALRVPSTTREPQSVR